MKRLNSWVLAGLMMAALLVGTTSAWADQATVTLAVSGMT